MDPVTLGMANAYAKKNFSRALTRQRQPLSDVSGFGAVNGPLWSNGTDLCMNSKHQYKAPIGGYSLVYVYANFTNQNGDEVDGLNPITVRAAHQPNDAGGYRQPVYFGGKRDVVIEPGGMAFSDPIGVVQAAGSSYWTWTTVSVDAAGKKWPLLQQPQRVPESIAGAVYSATYSDLTITGSITNNSQRGYGPVAVLAYPNVAGQPAIGILGDSIAAGSNQGDNGWVQVWLGGRYSSQNVAMSSNRISHWVDAPQVTRRRLPLLDGVTDVIINAGINDVMSGTAPDLATFQTRALKLWGMFAAQGKRVHQGTLLPSTDSTDNWATTTNQTVRSYEALRVQINNWIRTVPAPLTSVIDAADGAETARNSGIWKAGYCNSSSGGIHPGTPGVNGIVSALPALPLGLPVGV